MKKSKDEKIKPGTLAWQRQKIREEYVYPTLEKEQKSTRNKSLSKRNLFKKRYIRTEL